ncbi:MAG: DUF3784 domain-containing protein [Spirochaetaceae bacterium]|nr:DUF3784 domain-containing protein [Spirochaetaceae bacterium]
MAVLTITLTALLSLLFIVLGVFLVRGKFLELIAGYKKLSEEDKKSDSVRKIGKAAGIFLFVVAFLMVASVVIVQLFPAARTAVLVVLFLSMLVGITCVFLMKR